MSKLNPGNIINIGDIGTATVVRCLTPRAATTDRDINIYEVSCDDGHHEALAVDNGGTWTVGDEDDHDRNREQFLAIRGANGNAVEWDYIEDAQLREWIASRIDDVTDPSDWVVCSDESWSNMDMIFRVGEVPTQYDYASKAGFDLDDIPNDGSELPTVPLMDYVKSHCGVVPTLICETCEQDMAVQHALRINEARVQQLMDSLSR